MSENKRLRELREQESLLGEMIENRAKEISNHTAMVFYDEKLTYQEVNRRVDALSSALIDMGVTREDRIALILPTRPEFVLTWLAASKIGASVVGLNVRYRESELVYMINNAKPAVLVCINEFAGVNYGEFIMKMKSQLPTLKKFIFVGETAFPEAIDFNLLLHHDINSNALNEKSSGVDSNMDNFIIYTSGSTGQPKGAVLTQKSIMAMIKPWAANIELGTDDSFLCVLPLNHVGGGTILAMTTLACGATLVLHDIFKPDLALDIIKKQRITFMGGVPTIYATFFALPGFKKEYLASLKCAVYGGSAASPELLKKMSENMNAVIIGCYGATEVSGFCTYTSPSDTFDRVLSTVGRAPQGVEIKITDPKDRKKLPAGEIGEVAVRGDLLFDRYLDMPGETSKSFDSEGWFYTGDMGYLDEKGYLTIVGRYKEMYITGGYNVYPKEIEDVLMEHPAVAMAAVIGMPDEIKGEVGWAFIMKKPGAEIAEDEIKAFCADKVADYKIPQKVVIDNDLPMTPLGKIHKPTLKDKALGNI